MTKIPVEAIHAFANAYKFGGATRASGPQKLEFQLPAYGQEYVTIDLLPGLRAAFKAYERHMNRS